MRVRCKKSLANRSEKSWPLYDMEVHEKSISKKKSQLSWKRMEMFWLEPPRPNIRPQNKNVILVWQKGLKVRITRTLIRDNTRKRTKETSRIGVVICGPWKPKDLWLTSSRYLFTILSNFFFFFANLEPLITHVKVRITFEPGNPSTDKNRMLLELECFALSPTLVEGDLVLEAEHDIDGVPQVQKSTLGFLSKKSPTIDGKQLSSFLNVLRNTVYKVVIRRKEDLHQDGNTHPVMKFSFRYEASIELIICLCSLHSVFRFSQLALLSSEWFLIESLQFWYVDFILILS